MIVWEKDGVQDSVGVLYFFRRFAFLIRFVRIADRRVGMVAQTFSNAESLRELAMLSGQPPL